MNYFKKPSLNTKECFLVMFVFFLTLGLLSCESKEKKALDTEPSQTLSSDSTKQGPVILATKFPRFRVDTTKLPKVNGNNPSKFLIKLDIGDLKDPINTMNLLLYPAQNHVHYGRGSNPVITTHQGDTTLDVMNVVLGNNELPTSQLVSPGHGYFFDHLIFTPTVVTTVSDNKTHLVFIVTAFDKTGNPLFKPNGVVIILTPHLQQTLHNK
jgi:hypothetical protein